MERRNDIPVVPLELSNSDIMKAFLALARAITSQVNLTMVPRVNVVDGTMTSRFRDFVRMNPAIFLGFNVGEDPQEFTDAM